MIITEYMNNWKQGFVKTAVSEFGISEAEAQSLCKIAAARMLADRKEFKEGFTAELQKTAGPVGSLAKNAPGITSSLWDVIKSIGNMYAKHPKTLGFGTAALGGYAIPKGIDWGLKEYMLMNADPYMRAQYDLSQQIPYMSPMDYSKAQNSLRKQQYEYSQQLARTAGQGYGTRPNNPWHGNYAYRGKSLFDSWEPSTDKPST